MKTISLVVVAGAVFFLQVSDSQAQGRARGGNPFDALSEQIDDLQDQLDGVEPIADGTIVGQLLEWDGDNWVAELPTPVDGAGSNVQPFQAIYCIIALQGLFPSRNQGEPFLGQISWFGGNFAPRGWATCDGQLLPISQNQALFSILGTTYGGDGRTTFGLPDMRGRVPLHAGQGPGLSDYRLGDRGGSEDIAIDTHTH